MTITRVHVNQHVIRANAKHGKMPNDNDAKVVLILSGIAMLYFSCYIGV